ncbi:MAG: enoyl-CoA hydratase-related protein [Bacteriovorax sp.]|jgi:methylglutaconyl-CoA hydratase
MFYKKQIDKRGVATITLDRPDVHNAFNDEMISALIDCFNQMSTDNSIRLVVITGTGKSFCAGADLNWMKRMKDYSYDENLADSQKLAELFTVINKFTKPTIARMNGAALGGGAGLIACCDYVIAIDTALVGFTEVRLGLLPAVISPFVIAKIGESHARAAFLSGVRFDMLRAVRMGLVHQISSFDKLDEDLEALVKEYLAAAPEASIMAKKLIADVISTHSIEEAKHFTCELISKVRAGKEGQEGMSALLEKRKASWQ